MTVHVVAYIARGDVHGVARVRSHRVRPSWSECARAIPGYVTGRYLGVAPEGGKDPR